MGGICTWANRREIALRQIGRKETAANFRPPQSEDSFKGVRCCSAILVYDDLAGEKVHRVQNTIAAYTKIFANNIQPLVY